MGLKGLQTIFLAALAGLLVATVPVRAEPLSIVGFGDSLMAGYQLPPDDAFPVKLEKALRNKGLEVTIANAGVSGDTTSAGLARIDWSIPDGTDGVILELGANDALRGISPVETRRNLDAMLARLKDRNIPVLLVGIFAPPNLGEAYSADFNSIFPDLAKTYGLPLYPFFLDGVITEASLKLEDGMHPNADGVDTMVERFLPVAEQFVQSLARK